MPPHSPPENYWQIKHHKINVDKIIWWKIKYWNLIFEIILMMRLKTACTDDISVKGQHSNNIVRNYLLEPIIVIFSLINQEYQDTKKLSCIQVGFIIFQETCWKWEATLPKMLYYFSIFYNLLYDCIWGGFNFISLSISLCLHLV